MKFLQIFALLVASTSAIKITRDNNVSNNDTVRPAGESHIEPPGQARDFKPLKAYDRV